MMDKRLLKSNGHVAHSSLRGKVDAQHFTDGELIYLSSVTTDLLDAPDGSRQCQLVWGDGFIVLEKTKHAFFGFRESDGYCGWVRAFTSQSTGQPTHRINVPRAVALEHPDVTNGGHEMILPFGARVEHWSHRNPEREALARSSGWMQIKQPTIHIPLPHYIRETQLVPATHNWDDPVSVAELLLHTPYIWGGDSGLGIDCSGLVQLCMHSCGRTCPRDSDMQATAFSPITRADLKRGDLVFWKGHVGMMRDAETLIHANAHHMAVASEPLDQAIERIGKKEFGAVTGFARP